jgi:hypothetical protein
MAFTSSATPTFNYIWRYLNEPEIDCFAISPPQVSHCLQVVWAKHLHSSQFLSTCQQC